MVMIYLRDLIEPGAVITIFAIGTFINRRKALKSSSDVEAPIALEENDAKETGYGVTSSTVRHEAYDFRPRRHNIQSRLLARFPFLIEIWYWLLTYWTYQGLRAVSAKAIAGNDAVFDTAYIHAFEILFFERIFHLDIELWLQRFVLQNMPWLMYLLTRVYFSHIVLGVAFLVYWYTYFPRGQFTIIRRTIAVENVIAFVIFTLWRCTPPRLLPEEFGFIDVFDASSAKTAWSENGYRLTIAAMPSLHFANSLFVGYCFYKFSPHAILRSLAPLWPVMMGLSIIATANHYVLDLIVGVGVLCTAYRFNRAILVLLPVEEFLFRLTRLEKPDDID
ncbi:hypothetical protein VTN77DRAFT_372 [Rasamsonia byssochlamydoides]|uniref:uncharacterized protein n=1 Tax=Rasamsonia byssochlamydoides TaxID=89139 RepID=UPI003744A87E